MIAGIRANCRVNDCAFMSFSGISGIQKAIAGLESLDGKQAMMIELLACEGGCINGPAMTHQAGTIVKRTQVLNAAAYEAAMVPRPADYAIDQPLPSHFAAPDQTPDGLIRQALRDVGKFGPEDELNCGGCGYDSCRDFGRALVAGKAERAMCVTYMRQLAHKKANALIQKMPSAVVIVGPQLQVLECNSAFAQLLNPGPSPANISPADASAQLEGKSLTELISFHRLFAGVLQTGEDIVDRDLRFGKTILHLSIFTIEKHSVVGGIIQDITEPAVQKGQVIRRAREVIQRNLATVQQIAFLLGENAAESETTLNSIIDSFAPPSTDDLTLPGSDGTGSPGNSSLQAPDPAAKKNEPNGGAHGDNDDWRQLYRR
jgi:PAS domain-containing protein